MPGSEPGRRVLAVERKIPRTMSTQHPDNARLPQWCRGRVIEGDDEIYEAYFAFSELGCQEVMWDSEGKDVDTRVVRKLLTSFGDFFRENVLGRDFFLTYRIPNPRVEVVERKIVVETLENIPVSSDVASAFYGREVAPIFEVILPFTTSGDELVWLLNYYRRAVVGVEDLDLGGGVRTRDWVGPLRPGTIEVIPLVEDMESLLRVDEVVRPYVDAARPRYLRVFIARSDPALNYGLVCATVLSKLALSKLKALEGERGVPIYPIIGVGTLPFRGHLSPDNVRNFLEEYRGVYTVTIQSAFKYDYPTEVVGRVVRALNDSLPYGEVEDVAEEETATRVIAKFKSSYQSTVEKLAPLINNMASYVPARRARKLHVGLFGYPRRLGDVALPRAIPFAGALYSLGLPPEFIGLRALYGLDEGEWRLLEGLYVKMRHDLDAVAKYLSMRNLDALADLCGQAARRAGMEEGALRAALEEVAQDLRAAEEVLSIRLGPRSLADRKYENAVNSLLASYLERDDAEVRKYLEEAAVMRRCIG